MFPHNCFCEHNPHDYGHHDRDYVHDCDDHAPDYDCDDHMHDH